MSQPETERLFQPEQPPAVELGPLPEVVPDTPAPTVRNYRKPAVVAAAALAFVLVAAGGAFVARRLLTNGARGTQPEAVLPASTAAFARLDLVPGYGQRVAMADLLARFPDAGDPARRILDAVAPGLGDDVRPWFADRIGVGLWTATAHPVRLIALASRDDAEAAAALRAARDRVGPALGYVVRDGYAVLAHSDDGKAQAAAEAAVRAAASSPLSGSPEFATAVAALPADAPLLAWVDGPALAAVATALPGAGEPGADGPGAGEPGAGGPGASPAGGMVPPVLGSLLSRSGTVTAAARAVTDGIEVRIRATGLGGGTPATGDVRARLDALPGNSIVAGVLDGFDGRLADLLGGAPLTNPAGTPSSGAGAGAFDEALRGARMIDVALTALTGDLPGLALGVRARDAAAATRLAAALDAVADRGTLTTRRTGDRVEVTTRGHGPGGGRLAGSALYAKAMAGLPEHAHAAFYVDVRRLTADLSATHRKALTPVKAVGAAVGDSEAAVHIVIN